MSAQKRNLVAFVAIVLTGLSPHWASAQYQRTDAVIQANEAGNASREAEDFETAIQAYDQAIAMDDTFPEPHFGKAECLRELEDYESAIKSYSAATQLNQDYAQAYNGRGVCWRPIVCPVVERGRSNGCRGHLAALARLDLHSSRYRQVLTES